MYSREMPEDMKTWLLATKGEQYVPPPPLPPKKTTNKKTAKRKFGGMDVEEFNDTPMSYIYGKPLVWLQVLTNPRHSSIRRLHTWYMAACKKGVSFIEATVPYECFLHIDQKIHINFMDMHDMFRLDKLNRNFLRLWCL